MEAYIIAFLNSITWPTTVDLIKNLAWPFVALVAICKFGNPVVELLKDITEVKIKDWLSFKFKETRIKQIGNDPLLRKSLEETKAIKTEELMPVDMDIAKQIEDYIKTIAEGRES
ncbi:MAG TPA: hypothetical protein DD725_05720 [Deltaproteobacteria bacterium]|nr:hypothetical protein [Deltaproteobacteria bacterium]